jgi:hypothetical protein
MKIFRGIATNFQTQGFGLEGTKLEMIPFYVSIGLNAHNGFDWRCDDGENLFWHADCYGKVIKMDYDYNGGWGLEILTEDKDGAFKHRFWHLKQYADGLKVGDTVSTGAWVAKCDNTGKGTTGTHLHFDLKRVIITSTGGYDIVGYDNGYRGCISPQFYFENIFVLDKMKELEAKVSLLQKLLEALKKLFDLLKQK